VSSTPAGSVVALDTEKPLTSEYRRFDRRHVLCKAGVALAYHVIQRLEDDRVLVRDTGQRRIYADTILRIGRDAGLFCFGLPDNHSHAGVECDRSTAGRFAQRLAVALRQNLGLVVPFSPVRLREIRDQGHLNAAFSYILAQSSHHGIDADPWLEATAVPDLLGLRVIGGYLRPRVRALLPRVRRADLLAKLAIEELDAGLTIDDLADAAAAVVAAPALIGRARAIVDARRAAIGFARGHGADTARIGKLLGMSARAVRWLELTPARPELVRAIGLQLGLRARLPRPSSDFEVR
jgi:hypothetical protein